jgi:hypothetical protein
MTKEDEVNIVPIILSNNRQFDRFSKEMFPLSNTDMPLFIDGMIVVEGMANDPIFEATRPTASDQDAATSLAEKVTVREEVKIGDLDQFENSFPIAEEELVMAIEQCLNADCKKTPLQQPFPVISMMRPTSRWLPQRSSPLLTNLPSPSLSKKKSNFSRDEADLYLLAMKNSHKRWLANSEHFEDNHIKHHIKRVIDRVLEIRRAVTADTRIHRIHRTRKARIDRRIKMAIREF